MWCFYVALQASLSTGVMFASYVLHARFQPFLQKAAIPMQYLKMIRDNKREGVPEHILKAYDDNPQYVLSPLSCPLWVCECSDCVPLVVPVLQD